MAQKIEQCRSLFSTMSATWLNTNVVLTTSVVQTGLAFLIVTILARRMSPEEFGLYRLLIDTMTTAAPMLLFGLQYTWMQTIASTSSETEQSQQKGAVLVIASGLVVLSVFGAKVLVEPLLTILGIGKYSVLVPYFFVICIPLFRDMVEGILVAQAKFVALAFSTVIPQALIFISVLFLFPLNIATVSVTMALITTLGVLSSMVLTGISLKSVGKQVLLVLRANKRIGLPLYISGIIMLIARNVIQILTGARLDSLEYGNLSLALMFAGLLSLIPSAISKAKFRDFAIAPKISSRIFTWGCFSMIVGAIALWIGLYIYVLFVLGENYVALLWLGPVFMAVTIVEGIGYILNRFFLAKGKTAILAKISVIVGIFSLISGVLLIQLFGVWGVVTERISASVLFLGLCLFEYRKH